MTIVGFNFDSLSVEKTALPKGQISIKNDIKIKGVEKEDFPLEKGKKEMLRVLFEFSTEYEPKVGILNLKGHVSYLA